MLTYLGDEADHYGRQRMFGSLGWGLAMFFVGIALDHSTAFPGHPCGPHEKERNYTICFAVFSVLMGCALITASQFKVSEKVLRFEKVCLCAEFFSFFVHYVISFGWKWFEFSYIEICVCICVCIYHYCHLWVLVLPMTRISYFQFYYSEASNDMNLEEVKEPVDNGPRPWNEPKIPMQEQKSQRQKIDEAIGTIKVRQNSEYICKMSVLWKLLMS